MLNLLLEKFCRENNLIWAFSTKVPEDYLSYDKYKEWTDSKMHGDMAWMENRQNLTEYLSRYPWVKCIMGFVYKYYSGEIPKSIRNDKGRGIIARYAWGEDYHRILGRKFEPLQKLLNKDNVQTLFKCDTEALLERDLFNRLFQKGFIGRNSMYIIPKLGSFTNLCLLLSSDFIENPKRSTLVGGSHEPGSRCGECRLCITKCPTGAIGKDGVIDARKCISYLTIEHKGQIPQKYHKAIGNRIFGCDICQEVCPYNRDESVSREWDAVAPNLEDLAGLTEAEFKEKFKGTPIIRTGYINFMRNVKIALTNKKSG